MFLNFAAGVHASVDERRDSNGYIRKNTRSTYHSATCSGIAMYFQPKSLMLYSNKPSVISTLLIPTSTVGLGAHKMRLPCVRTAYSILAIHASNRSRVFCSQSVFRVFRDLVEVGYVIGTFLSIRVTISSYLYLVRGFPLFSHGVLTHCGHHRHRLVGSRSLRP